MADTNGASNSKTKSNRSGTHSAEHHVVNAAHVLDAKLSGPLAPLEIALNDIFGSKAALQIPGNIKDLLVKYAPWLSLLGGVLGILSAISLWRAAHYVNEFTESLNRFSEAYGAPSYMNRAEIGLVFWLAMTTILVSAVLAFLAFPGLKARKKVGWNILFYSLIVNVVYGFISLFYEGGGFTAFLGAIIVSAVWCYVLFQLRERYVSK